MTKEQIEEMAKLEYPDSDYASNKAFIERARECWVKGFTACQDRGSDAAEFAEWISLNKSDYDFDGKGQWHSYPKQPSTSQELYNEFKKVKG